MRLEDVLAKIQEPEALEVLRPHWEESVAALAGGLPHFLLPSEFTANREWCGFGPEVDVPLHETARRIIADPALTHLAWHCYRLLYDHTDYNEMKRWPTLERALGERCGVFYLLVTMAMAPRVIEVHRKMGVAEATNRETLSQVSAIAGRYRSMAGGRLGVTLNTIYWMRHYVAGRLFRVGRMEYMIQPWNGGVGAWRRRATNVFPPTAGAAWPALRPAVPAGLGGKNTGEVLALAPDGTRYNGSGYGDGANGKFDTERGWTAKLVADAESVTGCPISPHGMAVRREVRLPKSEWECVLKKGDLSLQMHIPAGGGMTLERCGDSMRRAVPFFRRLFPDQPFKAITCGSWIFNTQFEEIKLSSDNLVRYQRELYLFPTPSSGRDGLWFIFLQDPVDPATAPRDTSLRRAVADFLAAGHTWRGGGMFYLADDLSHFGTQHYRSHWPPKGVGL